MYNSKRKTIFKISALICIVPLIAAQAPAITTSQLQQIIKDTEESVTTAHLVYIMDFNDNYPVAGSDDDTMVLIRKANKHQLTRVDDIIDLKNKRTRALITDLRDLDALLEKYNLPAEQKMNISLSRASVIEETYEMIFNEGFEEGGPAQLALTERPGKPPRSKSSMLSFGIIDDELLSQQNNPTFSEVNSEGKNLLRIQLTQKRQDANLPPINIKIDCDPAFSYRFYRIEKSINGNIGVEKIADDYRIVNGIPYPFLYIKRYFDENGKILREIKYTIENAEFGLDLSAKDFKLLIPQGTAVTDTILSMTTFEVEKADYMGVDDVLSLAMKHR